MQRNYHPIGNMTSHWFYTWWTTLLWPNIFFDYYETQSFKRIHLGKFKKKFIRKSKSPAGTPTLFVKKHDGSLKFCVDSRRLNAITIRNSYPIPHINDLIESFKGANFFSRLDLMSAYNLVRIKTGHEYLTHSF